MQKHIYFSDLEATKAAISRKKTHQRRRGDRGKQAQPEADARRRFAQAPTAMPTNPLAKGRTRAGARTTTTATNSETRGCYFGAT